MTFFCSVTTEARVAAFHVGTCCLGQHESVFPGHGQSYLALNKLYIILFAVSTVFFMDAEWKHISTRRQV